MPYPILKAVLRKLSAPNGIRISQREAAGAGRNVILLIALVAIVQQLFFQSGKMECPQRTTVHFREIRMFFFEKAVGESIPIRPRRGAHPTPRGRRYPCGATPNLAKMPSFLLFHFIGGLVQREICFAASCQEPCAFFIFVSSCSFP